MTNPFKKTCCFLLCCTLCFACCAQLQPVYVFQQDDTAVKKDYYAQSLKKKNDLLATAAKPHKDEYKKIYEDRLDQVKELLLSSRSVTDPAVHQYLQSVADRVIAANPELKGIDARILFTRDWWPNAYSMGDGIIAINAGLFVFMNNEAELAFVLCHELAHYYLDHSGEAIHKYVETVNSESFQKELKRLSKEQYRVNEQLEKLSKKMVFDSRRHSRDKETEADQQALLFLKKTGYSGTAAISSLQMLDKADDSSLFKPLRLEELFSFSDYPFKSKWIQKESAIFSQLGKEEDTPLSKKEKDSLKTHPDCAKRILLLEEKARAISGAKFLVNETRFGQLKQDFLTEIMEQCYRGNNLGRNLYYGLQFVQEGRQLSLAVYTIARCLNDLYKRQKEHELGLALDSENKKFPEDYNLLLRMLGKLKLQEIATLNYYFCARYREQMKDHPSFLEEMRLAERLKN